MAGRMKKLVKLGRGTGITRLRGGVPSIRASNLLDAMRAMGYIHVIDRGFEMEMRRLLAFGRLSSLFGANETLVDLDTVVRRSGIYRFPERDIEPLSPATQALLKAYTQGVRLGWKSRRMPIHLRLFGQKSPSWRTADTIRILRIAAIAGAVSYQLPHQLTLIDLVQRGISQDKLKELFTRPIDDIDTDLINSIERPRDAHSAFRATSLSAFGLANIATASNAWAIGADHTATKAPIIANDLHNEISYLPSIWYEIELHTPEVSVSGATTPGLPFVFSGRSTELGWAVAHAHADACDLYVEECRDGKRRFENQWKPFRQRVEEVRVGGSETRRFSVFESKHGVLEGNPYVPGRYLSVRLLPRPGRFYQVVEGLFDLIVASNVNDGRRAAKKCHFPSLSWVFADAGGNIGSQVGAAVPRRAAGKAGRFPLYGWERENDWNGGKVCADSRFGCTNPEAGFIVAANQRQKSVDPAVSFTTHEADYRYRQISACLSERKTWSIADVQRLQFDVVSRHAQQLMPVFLPFMAIGEDKSELERWQFTYHSESHAALLFENIYHSALRVVFGDGGIGRSILVRLVNETTFHTLAVQNIADILSDRESAWFDGRDYDDCIRQAVVEGLEATRATWGDRNRVTFKNRALEYRNQFNNFVERGPYGLSGNHSTIHLTAWRTENGEERCIGPGFRFVSDMGSNTLWCNLPGGPSENPMGRYYSNDVGNWRYGDYKRLRLKRQR